MLSEIQKEMGDWSARESLRAGGKIIDPHKVAVVDRTLLEIWNSLPESSQTLWTLNTMVYVGAETLLRCPSAPEESPFGERDGADSGDEPEVGDEEVESSDSPSPKSPSAKTEKLKTSVKRLQEVCRHV